MDPGSEQADRILPILHISQKDIRYFLHAHMLREKQRERDTVVFISQVPWPMNFYRLQG